MKAEDLIIDGPLDPSTIAVYIADKTADKSAGAHSVFTGQVRDDKIKDRTVKAIEYSAYDDMVIKEYKKIKDTVLSAFNDVKDVIIIHSRGIVKAGEISLFVLVTAGHRDQAMRACRHVVEMIKEHYPVWKKEIFEDDSHQWQ